MQSPASVASSRHFQTLVSESKLFIDWCIATTPLAFYSVYTTNSLFPFHFTRLNVKKKKLTKFFLKLVNVTCGFVCGSCQRCQQVAHHPRWRRIKKRGRDCDKVSDFSFWCRHLRLTFNLESQRRLLQFLQFYLHTNKRISFFLSASVLHAQLLSRDRESSLQWLKGLLVVNCMYCTS